MTKKHQEEIEAATIEEAILDGTFLPVEDLEGFKDMMQSAVKQTTKKKNIHIGINENVLQKIKAKAYQEGMPYQTLINQILHKYSKGEVSFSH